MITNTGGVYSSATELWEVRFRDIDPDTGSESQNLIMAVCFTEDYAVNLSKISERDYQNHEQNPNREFFVKKINLQFK